MDDHRDHPVVRMDDGRAMADSRDVAAYFDRNHFDVLRTLRNLSCSPEFRECNFASFKINDLAGDSTSHVMMTKDGFTFLAMGFTGEKAGRLKEAYIAKFNAMEAELVRRAADPMRALNDPAAMRGLLLTYCEKVLALQAENAELTPKAEALDRIATACEGSLNITMAAKALQVRPKDLFAWLNVNRWIYRRNGSATWLGYQDKTVTGYIEHKVTTVHRTDGTEKIVEQVLITAKGLTKLSALMKVPALCDA